MVEAGQRSGAVNTARHARDLHRLLMAVPGPVTSDLSAGCHDIIRDWQATLVTSASEVIAELAPVTGLPEAEDAVGRQALPRDLLDRETAEVLDALPRRGGMSTIRLAQRAGLAPARDGGVPGPARHRRVRRAVRGRLAAAPPLSHPRLHPKPLRHACQHPHGQPH